MLKRGENAKHSVTISSSVEREPDDPVHPLPDDKELLLGKADTCDIKCHDDFLDPEHCYIRAVGDEVWFTDNYTRHGCYFQVKPQMQMPLTGGGFCLGNTFFSIQQKDKETYTIIKESTTGKETFEFNVTKTPLFYIGRDSNDQIPVMDDDTISAHHAQLHFDLANREWTIKDHGRKGTGSSNGTWVRIGTATIFVMPKDIIRVGKECFLTF